MKYSEKISNRLNDLLIRTNDAEKGYKLAEEKVDNMSIKTFFNEKAQQRNIFGTELKNEIISFGQMPDESGSFRGDIHRTWMNLTTAFFSNDTERILEEVERGEKSSLAEYNEILNDTDTVLSPSTENLLMKQRKAIQSSLNVANRFEELVS